MVPRVLQYEIYRSLKSIRGGHEFSEQPDEFILIYGEDKPEAVELIEKAVLYLYGDL